MSQRTAQINPIKPEMNIPNFVIAGSPRSGTTSLYTYLSEHPQIYMPDEKEPSYFAFDFEGFRPIRTFDDYINLFNGVQLHHVAIGEASIISIISEVALQEYFKFNPKLKVIIILRNPIDQFVSAYYHNRFHLWEDARSLELAWSLQSARRDGQRIPSTCMEERSLQYRVNASYGSHVERALETFPREQIHFILFDDMKADLRAVYCSVLEFLGVDDDHRHNFEQTNSYSAWKWHWLAHLTARKPAGMFYRAKTILDRRNIPSGLVERARLKLIRVNRTTKRKPLNPKVRTMLVDEFRDEIEKLGKLLGRDLSHWLC